MKEKKVAPPTKKDPAGMIPLFEKGNFTLMLVGAGLMILGFLLMAGGRSEGPHVFNPDEIYGFRRITLAPLLILAGLVVELIAIFRVPKKG